MQLTAVFEEIDRHREEACDLLCQLVSIPSVASRPDALAEAARAVAGIARGSGLEAEVVDVAAGPPVVVAERPAPEGAPTVLLYGHYDVQPPEPLEAWTTPPFEPDVRDGAVYGRGAGDNKGQLLAHFVALRCLDATGGCPVGVKVLVDGEEEVGSPNLGASVRDLAPRLRADLALTADGPYHEDGRPLILFGVRGLLYLELRARGANRDLHSGNRGGIVPNPAWTLVEALSRLRDDDGRVRLEGYHEAVVPPGEQERLLLDRLPAAREELLADLGLTDFPPQARDAPWEALMFRPNLNIAGMSAGYAGPGAKTVIPATATVKLDFRLVPDQEPDAVEASVRAALADLPVEIERLAAVPASGTPVDTPFTEPLRRALETATGAAPVLRPRLGGTTPDWVFTRILGLPSLLIPYGPPDMNHHAPDERMDLESLRRGIRSTAAVFHALASSQKRPQ